MTASKKNEPIIEVKHLSKQYNIGVDKTYKTLSDSIIYAVKNPLKTLKESFKPSNTFWSLKDVNLDIECGEVLGIIGRNGAGKSTFLKVLSRITYPTEGEVRLRGLVGSLLEVGTGFHPELSGRENIYFNGAILGMKKREIDEKFDEIVTFSGVEKFLDTPVKRYSSGMQVRLAFSVAAHLEPDILLVDEVLAVGDVSFQKKCLGKMEEVAEGGQTVLFVSHNLNAVEKLCERSIYLSNGIVKNDGSTKDIICQYLSDIESFSASESFSQRINRKGNGDLRFINVYFENFFGEKLNILSSGEDTKIILDYVCKKIQKNVLISLEIIANGERFIHFDTYLTEQNFEQIPLNGKIICNIPKLPLLPGTYSLTLYTTSNMIETDWVEEATVFQVKGGNFFKSCSLPSNNSARILVDHYWEVTYD